MAPPRSLKARALQWLAQREQSRSELRRKLLRVALLEARPDTRATHHRFNGSGNTSAEANLGAGNDTCEASEEVEAPLGETKQATEARVDEVLDWLQAHDFLSQERFVESRVHARSARFGNMRIRQELKQHQLTLSPELKRSLSDSERQRACDVRSRKFGDAPMNVAERAKQARYLAARGFSPEAIAQALRHQPDDLDRP